MGFGLDALQLHHVVEHVFAINLLYWMLGFDAGTAEKIVLKIKNGAETSGEKRGRMGKGAKVLVTATAPSRICRRA